MADLRISELPALLAADAEAADDLAIADYSSSETKRLTLKGAVQQGVSTLIDNAVIPGAKLVNDSVTTTQIAANAITATELADGSVGTDALADGAITGIKLAAGGIDGSKLTADTVTAAQIATGAITASELASNAVTTAAIADGAVTNVKIASGIDGAKLTADSVTATQISASAITASELADNAVTSAKIAADAVTTSKIADGAITDAKLAIGGIDGAKISDGTVTNAKLATGIDGGKLVADSVTTTQIAASAVGTSELAENAVATSKLAADAVTADKIADDAVVTAAILDNSVTNAKLATGIDGAKLTVASVAATKLATVTDRGLDQTTGSIGHTNSVTAGSRSGITFDAEGHITGTVALTASDLPVATESTIGAVSIPANSGLTVTALGAVDHANNITGGSVSGITFDEHGHIVSAAALVSGDIPIATQNTIGGVAVPAGSALSISGTGDIEHEDSPVVTGTYSKVTVDQKGHVTAGETLIAADIPDLNASKITAGTLDVARIGSNSLTGPKLANYSITKIGDVQPTADQIGQFFFNPLSRDLFLWDGNVYQPIGISVGEIVFAGTFDASAGGGTGLVDSVTAEGTAIGLVIGQALPAAATANNRYYLVVSTAGTITSGNAPNVALAPPDIILSNGNEWTEIDVSQTFTSVTASQVAFTPAGNISATHVQSAIEELDSEKLGGNGGTVTGELLVGSTGTFVFEGATDNAFETTLGVIDPTADNAINLPDVSGTVITTGDTGTVTNTMLAGSIADTKLNTISTANKVSASAVDIDGATDIGAALADADLFLVDDGGAGTNRKAAATRVTDYAFGKVSGDITIASNGTAAIGSGVIVNADVNASAAIAFSKLANVSATDKLLGRSSAGAGAIEEITCTAAGRALIDDADAAAQRTTLGLVIGTDVQAYDADTAKLDVIQTFTAVQTLTNPAIIGTILEDVYTITDGAAFEVDPGNGSVQLITLGANRTPLATNFAAGESVTLMVDDGTAYTLTWTDSTWGTGGVIWTGGSAPTLATSGYTVLQFWKVGSQVYGALVGEVA